MTILYCLSLSILFRQFSTGGCAGDGDGFKRLTFGLAWLWGFSPGSFRKDAGEMNITG
jgi:hypothetical protein